MFLEERQPAVLEALAAAITADEQGRWIIDESKRNASDYGLIFIPGTRQRAYAHHVAFALFHGGWTADQQVHHRTQLRPEISPWTLQAVAITEHEQLKDQPPILVPVKVPQQQLLEEYAAQYGLPLPWHEQEKPRTPLLELFGDEHPGLLEPAPAFEIPVPTAPAVLPAKPKRLRLAGTNITFEPIDYTPKESTVDNVIPLDERRPQTPTQAAARSFLEATAAPRELTLEDHRRMQTAAAAEYYRLQDERNAQEADCMRADLRFALTSTR
ncbi:hypothetical protein [Kocuria rosea]|uniref:Uncharacterized protein n=1 Tax=Kocuria rosea subsp. polaris TaxID=136273 RepID=A0A0A6VPX7_KOCRO|nr:hypothetical protein [Kocuria polaris]KHD96453.1 hypothetical protein GY22_15790 [Kocuria polaris]